MAVVLVGLPVAGAVSVVRGRRGTSAWLLLCAGIATLGFETLFHFVLPGTDNVASVTHGAELFRSTSVLSSASDALVVLAGGWIAWRHRQGSSATSATVSKT